MNIKIDNRYGFSNIDIYRVSSLTLRDKELTGSVSHVVLFAQRSTTKAFGSRSVHCRTRQLKGLAGIGRHLFTTWSPAVLVQTP